MEDKDKGTGDENRVPLSRLNEEIEKRRTLESRISAMEKSEADRKAAEEENQRKILEEQGKYKTLADELKAKLDTEAATRTSFETRFKKVVENQINGYKAKIAELPDGFKDLVPTPTEDNLDTVSDMLVKVSKLIEDSKGTHLGPLPKDHQRDSSKDKENKGQYHNISGVF